MPTATFGKTTVAGTWYSFALDMIAGSKGSKFIPQYSGDVTSITARLRTGAESELAQCAIYKVSDNSLVGYTEEKSIPGGYVSGWFTFNIISGGQIEAGVEYWLVVWGTKGIGFLSEDVTDAGGRQILTYATGAFPDPWSPSSINEEFSIYATYTYEIPPVSRLFLVSYNNLRQVLRLFAFVFLTKAKIDVLFDWLYQHAGRVWRKLVFLYHYIRAFLKRIPSYLWKAEFSVVEAEIPSWSLTPSWIKRGFVHGARWILFYFQGVLADKIRVKYAITSDQVTWDKYTIQPDFFYKYLDVTKHDNTFEVAYTGRIGVGESSINYVQGVLNATLDLGNLNQILKLEDYVSIEVDTNSYPYIGYYDINDGLYKVISSSRTDGIWETETGYPVTVSPYSIPLGERCGIKLLPYDENAIYAVMANETITWGRLIYRDSLGALETISTDNIWGVNEWNAVSKDATIYFVAYKGGTWGRITRRDPVAGTWSPEQSVYSRYILQPHLTFLRDVFYNFYLIGPASDYLHPVYQTIALDLSTISPANPTLIGASYPWLEFEYGLSNPHESEIFAYGVLEDNIIVIPFAWRKILTPVWRLSHSLRAYVYRIASLIHRLRGVVSNFLSSLFNLRHSRQKTLQFLYNINIIVATFITTIATITALRRQVFEIVHSLKQFQKRFLTLLHSSIMRVKPIFTFSWRTLAYLLKTFEFPYLTRESRKKLLQSLHSLKALRSKVLDILSSLRKYAYKQFQILFTLKILRRQILGITFSLRGLISRTLKATHLLYQFVTSYLIMKFYIKVLKERLVSLYWKSLELRTRVLASIYLLTSTVKRFLNIPYAIIAKVSKALIGVYLVKVIRFKTFISTYLTKRLVTSTIESVYSLLKRITQLLSLRYLVAYMLVLRTFILSYLVLPFVTRILTSIFSLKVKITRTTVSIHKLVKLVSSRIVQYYKLKALREKLLRIVFNLKVLKTRILGIQFKLKALVRAIILPLWDLAGKATRTLVIYYHLIPLYLTKVLSIKYRVLPLVEIVIELTKMKLISILEHSKTAYELLKTKIKKVLYRLLR